MTSMKDLPITYAPAANQGAELGSNGSERLFSPRSPQGIFRLVSEVGCCAGWYQAGPSPLFRGFSVCRHRPLRRWPTQRIDEGGYLVPTSAAALQPGTSFPLTIKRCGCGEGGLFYEPELALRDAAKRRRIGVRNWPLGIPTREDALFGPPVLDSPLRSSKPD